MGSTERHKKRRSKKRVFKGNQHVPVQEPKRKVEKIRPTQKNNKELNASIEHTLGLSTEVSACSVGNGTELNTSHERSKENELGVNSETPKSSFSASSKFHLMGRKDKGEEREDDFRFFMESSVTALNAGIRSHQP